MGWLRSLTGLWVAGVVATSVALAQAPASAPAKPARLALVIGNTNYAQTPLPNAVNDARDMAALLKGLGFEVIQRENASLKDMHLALREFGDRLSREQMGLFYFAGHGVQVRGRNFLIPVDADLAREDEVAFSGFDVQAVMEKLDTARNHTNMVILDACRNNPFASRFKLANAGLAQIDAPPGTIVAFATAPGSVAADGTGRNGLYTKHLLNHLGKEGQRIEDAFKQVRAAVRKESGGLQTPWESTSLEGELYLKSAAPRVIESSRTAIGQSPSKQAAAKDAKVDNKTRPAAVEIEPGEPPRFAVGDKWEWRVNDHLRQQVRTFSRDITGISGNEVRYGLSRATDLQGNILWRRDGEAKRTYIPSSMHFTFPLTPGMKVTGRYSDRKGLQVYDNDFSLHVIGEEALETPAGKFRAIKVERTQTWKARVGNASGKSKLVYWYSAAAKNLLRQDWENATLDGKLLNNETMELVSFRVK